MDALYEHKGIDINSPIVNAITSGGDVVITGTPDAGSREGLVKIIDDLGLMPGMSLSKRTQLLVVCKDPQQKKIDRAEALGITTCTEAELMEAIAFVYSDQAAADLQKSSGALIYGKES